MTLQNAQPRWCCWLPRYAILQNRHHGTVELHSLRVLLDHGGYGFGCGTGTAFFPQTIRQTRPCIDLPWATTFKSQAEWTENHGSPIQSGYCSIERLKFATSTEFSSATSQHVRNYYDDHECSGEARTKVTRILLVRIQSKLATCELVYLLDE